MNSSISTASPPSSHAKSTKGHPIPTIAPTISHQITGISSSSRPPPTSTLHPDSARGSRGLVISRTTSAITPSQLRLSPPIISRTLSSTSIQRGQPSPALLPTLSAVSSVPTLPSKSSVQPLPKVKSSNRLSLKWQANSWRFLEGIGVYFNNWPQPIPPNPTFCRYFITSDTPSSKLELAFYLPEDYTAQIAKGKRYPVVVNFHGGGFTLGTTRDDARWAAFVLRETPAIFVSVEYRLAPEFPFPTAVEDGVEALLHLAAQSEEYGIDPKQIALSGFSAGANLSFAVPLRLQDHLRTIESSLPKDSLENPEVQPPLPDVVSIVSFYPAVDMRITRAQRRATSRRPDKTLPPILTDLFDESYIPDKASQQSPYASPAAADDATLTSALPDKIAFYLCEWDMLLKEGKDFATRLKRLGKDVECSVAKEKRHAFDKAPTPWGVDPKVGEIYMEASRVLREGFTMQREDEKTC